MVKVYSNCDEAELFVNGKSLGKKKRNIKSFPALGLRWMVKLNEGTNNFKVVATKDGKTITDEISQQYQTAKWTKPAKMVLEKVSEKEGVATIQVKLTDDKGILCLDAANYITFGLIGDGSLVDDQGTSSGSRKVQLSNGHAIISVKLNGGKSVASVKATGIPSAFIEL